MENPKWPLITFRVFAATNFLIAILGGLFLVITVTSITHAGAWGNKPAEPYFILAFWMMFATNICFLGLLGFGGFYLLRRRMLGVTVCNVVFVAEILYFLSIGFFLGFTSKIHRYERSGCDGRRKHGVGPSVGFRISPNRPRLPECSSVALKTPEARRPKWC